jgi:peptide/nickel transport system substrate-binding protein
VAGAAGVASLALPVAQSFAATDELRIGLAHEPPDLDSVEGHDPATLAISYQNLFEGLTRLDEYGAVLPNLAKAWTFSPDKLACSFALVADARYHDGTGFDAEHVVFSLKRLLAAEGDRAAPYTAIADVVAAGPGTVQLTLSRPDDRLLYKLALPAAGMVAPESADSNNTLPIGTGPFAFVQWDSGQSVVLERNEDYWGQHPRISQAIFAFVTDPATAVAALLNDELDGFPAFPAPDALAPLRPNPAFRIIEGKGPDGQPRTGVWNAKLAGMWADAPVESCIIGGIYWNEPGGSAPDVSPPAHQHLDEPDDDED